MSEVEYRYMMSPAAAIGVGQKRMIVGYAAIFNSPSEELTFRDGRRFREVVKPGAFTEAIRSRADVLARLDHDALLGRVGNGTLRLQEDQRGLKYEIDPPDTTAGRDAVELIRRGDVAYSSFAFTVRSGGDAWRNEGGELVREVRSAFLIDVSPVAKPAYLNTEVALRSFQASSAKGGWSERERMRFRLAEASGH